MPDVPVAVAADPHLQAVLDYHERSKHHLHRHARSLGQLDWANQPDPFRRFMGAAQYPLPLPTVLPDTPLYDQLYQPQGVRHQKLDHHRLSTLLFHSLALAASKSYRGKRWSLRVNPSSGNLHPTEAYLLLPPLPDLHSNPALYHYAPQHHALELRAEFEMPAFRDFSEGLPPSTFAMALTSIHWREAWKYGERAWRYCQLDVGHAMASVRLAAAMLGWHATFVPHLHDGQIQRLLGLNRPDSSHPDEREIPDLLMLIRTDGSPTPPHVLLGDADIYDLLASARFQGEANQLSPDHHEWEAIDTIDRAARKHHLPQEIAEPAPPPVDADALDAIAEPRRLAAAQIIRQRRSAVAMDGHTTMEADDFFRMLTRTLPGCVAAPLDMLTWRPRVHLGIFVHRVNGLTPGVYLLPREADRLPFLRQNMTRSDLLWQPVDDAPPMLPLYRLLEADARKAAETISCHQSIASEGVATFAMLAEFEPTLTHQGPHWYRHLHWEAGILGQILYLEAEAAGLRGTGIGCYFDDPTHHIFGITNRNLQDLYHFTFGGPCRRHPPHHRAPLPHRTIGMLNTAAETPHACRTSFTPSRRCNS